MENHPLVEEFMDLVRVGASSGDERGIADRLRLKLEEIGFQVKEDDAAQAFIPYDGKPGNCGNLIGVLEGELPGSILFTSHMDRVSNGYNVNPSVRDGKVVTDGKTILAADDLSGAMAIIDGMRRLKKSGKKLPRIEVLFCVGEEKCLLGSSVVDCSQFQSKLGFALDSPGRIGRVIKAAPSRALLVCEVFGKPAHAGNEPENGINAVTVLGKILAGIRDGRLDPESTANFSQLSVGNPSVNIVQEYAKVEGETRSLDTRKVEEYIQYFHEYCQKAAEGTGATIKTHADIQFASFDYPMDSQTIQLCQKVFGEMGIEMNPVRMGGGMDANNLYSRGGIECVGLATGYANNHTVNETLEIEDFLRSGEMVERLVLAYAASQQ